MLGWGLCALPSVRPRWSPSAFRRCSSVCDFLWRRTESKHQLMVSAEIRTQSGIPPLCAHLLNLPSSGRRVLVYLSLLQWSAWPSSAPHTHAERSTHSFTSTQGTQKTSALCSTHGQICMLPLFPQNQRPDLTVGPSVRIVPRSSGTLVVEGRGSQMFLCWSYQWAPLLFIVSTLWQTNTLTCPGS